MVGLAVWWEWEESKVLRDVQDLDTGDRLG